MSKQIQDAYIVAATRTPVAKRNGMFRSVRPDDMLAHVLKAVVAKAAATALCGGEVDSNARVPEQWLLDVERALFVDLLKTEKTQQRILHMLETGKPLRN